MPRSRPLPRREVVVPLWQMIFAAGDYPTIALMLALFVIGVLWLAVFYITGGTAPVIDSFGNWNLAIGFGFIIGGFIVSTQWH